MKKKNKYAIIWHCDFINDLEMPLYSPRLFNDDNLSLLIYCIGFAGRKYKTFEKLKLALLEKKVLNFNIYDGLSEYAIAYNIEDNTVECVYVDFYKHQSKDPWKAEILLAEDCVEQHAQFPLNVFIEVAEKIINCFYQAQQWIIVWQDEQDAIYVDPYYPSKQEIEDAFKW